MSFFDLVICSNVECLSIVYTSNKKLKNRFSSIALYVIAFIFVSELQKNTYRKFKFIQMKTHYLITKWLIIAAILPCFLISCSDDDTDTKEEEPTVFQSDNSWLEDEITVGQELWYKVVADETFTTLYVEWAEADAHGEDRNYTADIQVSAFMLDGESPYFEDKDNGYKDKIRSFALDTEKQVLLKVTLTEAKQAGTFAIRSTGTGLVDLEYIDLAIGDSWTKGEIADGETIGYLVDCGSAEQVKIIWAEFDSPESGDGYTADIVGSVFHLDGETTYRDVAKDKDFLNKNKSHSDDPKIVAVDTNEGKIKLHIGVGTQAGTFAIKVIE